MNNIIIYYNILIYNFSIIDISVCKYDSVCFFSIIILSLSIINLNLYYILEMSIISRINKIIDTKVGYNIIKNNKLNRSSLRNSNCYRQNFDNFTGIINEKDILSNIDNTAKNDDIIKDNSTGMYDYLTCLKNGVVEKKSKYTNMTVREFDYCMYSEFELCMYSKYEFCIL